jgi:hypothetical protein
MTRLLALAALLLAMPAQATDWVTVGDPGNADDAGGLGGVSYSFRISKYEVTNARYALHSAGRRWYSCRTAVPR